MPQKELFTGIILAGGKSSRLGCEKGLLLYQGLTFAQKAVNTLSAFCNRIIINTSNSLYQQTGVDLVADLVPGKGPMMGLYSALMASTTPHNFVMAVDNCFVSQEYFEWIIPQSIGYQAAVPFFEGRYYEPLVGYYSKEILRKMEKHIDAGHYKLPDLLDSSVVNKLNVVHDFPGYHSLYFKSINLPEDLILLQDND